MQVKTIKKSDNSLNHINCIVNPLQCSEKKNKPNIAYLYKVKCFRVLKSISMRLLRLETNSKLIRK